MNSELNRTEFLQPAVAIPETDGATDEEIIADVVRFLTETPNGDAVQYILDSYDGFERKEAKEFVEKAEVRIELDAIVNQEPEPEREPESREVVIERYNNLTSVNEAEGDAYLSSLTKIGFTVEELAEMKKEATSKRVEDLETYADELKQTAMQSTDRALAAETERDKEFVENYCLKQNKRMPQTPQDIEKFARVLRKQQAAKLPKPIKKIEHTLLDEELAAELEKEYPVIPLVPPEGPSWDDSILYGKAGELTRKICEYNEAHPVGVMVDLLVSLGSLFGSGPYFNINSTKHHANEFVARIGETSRGRKGSGRDAVDELLKVLDGKWYAEKIQSGFGSGQSIVNEIRDSTTSTITDTKKGTSKEVVVPGIADKRLFIREGELAGVFTLAGQEGSTASTIIRDGWDGKPLRNMVKGKTTSGLSNSTCCINPHLSISGDITPTDLKNTMPEGSDSNGFANRFLYVYTYRVKLCPHGGPEMNWSETIPYFYEVVLFAKRQKLVPLSSAARNLWTTMYMAMEDEPSLGIVAAMTARAAAHIRRLATILALIEMSAIVEVEHLRAAEKIWDYCHDSVKFVFEHITRDQERILNWVRQEVTAGQAVTLRRIREELYGKNKLACWVRDQIDQLVRRGKLTLMDQIVGISKGA